MSAAPKWTFVTKDLYGTLDYIDVSGGFLYRFTPIGLFGNETQTSVVFVARWHAYTPLCPNPDYCVEVQKEGDNQ